MGRFCIRKASARSEYVADPQGAVHQNGGKATASGCEQDPRNHSPPQGRGCTGEQTGWRRWMGGYPARPTHGGWIDRPWDAVAGHPESWTNPAPCASQAARGDSPERLSAEARKSKVDQFGKVRCLVCGKTFGAHKPLEQHLAASHFGLNSMEAKALEAKLVAAGVHIPGDGSEKTKPDRMAIQFGEILDQPRSRPGDAPIANLATSLAAYIRETPKKKEKRAAAIGATGRMRHGGQPRDEPESGFGAAVSFIDAVRRG